MSREIYDPDEPAERLKQWLPLSNGKGVWIWELSAADHIRINERTVIRGRGQEQQASVGETLIWQILQSCFDSDGANARPVFTEEKILNVYRLRGRDYDAILTAIGEVNGTDRESLEALEDFTGLRAAESAGT